MQADRNNFTYFDNVRVPKEWGLQGPEALRQGGGGEHSERHPEKYIARGTYNHPPRPVVRLTTMS